MKFSIPKDLIRPLALLPANEFRPITRGILFRERDGELECVGTDGHSLAGFAFNNGKALPEFPLVIDRAIFEKLDTLLEYHRAEFSPEKLVFVEAEKEKNRGRVTLGEVSFEFEDPTEGLEFPKFENLFPTVKELLGSPNPAVAVNARLFGSIFKIHAEIAEALGNPHESLHFAANHRGVFAKADGETLPFSETPVVFGSFHAEYELNFFALAMPMREFGRFPHFWDRLAPDFETLAEEARSYPKTQPMENGPGVIFETPEQEAEFRQMAKENAEQLKEEA